MRPELIEALKVPGRAKHCRIGSLQRYLKRLAGAMGTARLARHAEVTQAELRKAIKSASESLVWFDPEHATPTGTACRDGFAKEGKVSGKGTLKGDDDKNEATLSTGSLMDFDTIVTTSRRDRDGDVLEPKGAIIDAKMPLLWQHIPVQPIGRLVRVLEQTDDKVTARFMIADTALGRDAAVLIEAGCLRVSHGFAPIEYNPLKDENGKDMGGWRISKYAMMETSAVSIPSNVDAEIEQFSRGKLHHPLVKGYCKMLSDGRKRFFKGGWDAKASKSVLTTADPMELTLNLRGLLGGGSVTVKCGKPNKPAPKGKKADDDADEDDKGGSLVTCRDCGNGWYGTGETECPKCGSTDLSGAGAKAEGEEDDEEEKADGEEEDDDSDGETDEGDGAGEARALGEIIDGVKELAKNPNLPKEAQRRLAVVEGMFEDIEGGIGASADAIATAAKSRDLAGMFTAMADIAESCVSHLRNAGDELARVSAVADLPEDVAESIGAIAKDAGTIVEAVQMMTGAAAKGDDGDESDMDDDPEAKDDDEAEPEEEEEDADEDDKAEDEDDEDSELEGEKEDDEDDRDEKEDDDEDAETKSEDDENPEADGDPGDENPGIERGKKPKRRRSAISRLLGMELTGKRDDLTPAERRELDEYLETAERR